LISLLLIDLGQSPSLGIEDLGYAGFHVDTSTAAHSHDVFISLLEGCLLCSM
jgi:hypothetical protein